MGTSFAVLDVGNVNLYHVALVQFVDTDLFGFGENGCAFADSDRRGSVFRVDTLNGGGDDLSELALELDQALSLFARAYSLTDNVARRRNRYSAQPLGVEGNLDLIADHIFFSLIDLLRFFDRDLKVGVVNLFDNGFYKLYVKRILFGLSLENNVVVASVIAFAGDLYSFLYLLKHKIHWDVLFFFKHPERFKQVLVSHFSYHSFPRRVLSRFHLIIYNTAVICSGNF